MTKEEKTKKGFKKEKQAVIRAKILEIIAKEISNVFDTQNELTNFLTECGVNEHNSGTTKKGWKTIYALLLRLARSGEKNKKILFRIIGETVNPISHKGNEIKANILLNKFNNLLYYDRMFITFEEEKRTFEIVSELGGKEREEILKKFHKEIDTEEKKQIKSLSQPKNKEKIALLRKSYQLLMDVVEVFCKDPLSPTAELNNSYLFLKELIHKTIYSLGLLKEDFYSLNDISFVGLLNMPFSNLFNAGKEYQTKKINWQELKPEMNSIYGKIEEIYQKTNSKDIPIKSKEKEKIEEIQLYLSVLKKKNKNTKKRKKESILEQKKSTLKPSFCLRNNIITLGNKKMSVPFDTKQYYLCKVMFKKKVNELVSWDKLAEGWKGYHFGKYKDKNLVQKDDWREVYDTVRAVNKKSKLNLGIDKLFIYKDKSVKRLM